MINYKLMCAMHVNKECMWCVIRMM